MTEVRDLLNQREKQRSTCHIFIAEQLGRGSHDFGVELDTDLPTMINIVDDDNSSKSVND